MSTLKRKEAKSIASAMERMLEEFFESHHGHTAPSGVYHAVMSEVEKPLIALTIKFVEGNQSKAAEILGLNRNTLRKKMSQHNIKV